MSKLVIITLIAGCFLLGTYASCDYGLSCYYGFEEDNPNINYYGVAGPEPQPGFPKFGERNAVLYNDGLPFANSINYRCPLDMTDPTIFRCAVRVWIQARPSTTDAVISVWAGGRNLGAITPVPNGNYQLADFPFDISQTNFDHVNVVANFRSGTRNPEGTPRQWMRVDDIHVYCSTASRLNVSLPLNTSQ